MNDWKLKRLAGWLNFFCAILLMAIAICALTPPAFGADEVGPTTPLEPAADRAPAENPPHITAGPAVQAQSPRPSTSLEAAIVSLATPLLVWLARLLAPKIPKPFIPIAAGLIGVLIDTVLPWIGLHATGYGFLLGLAGVGLREAKKQIGTVIANSNPA